MNIIEINKLTTKFKDLVVHNNLSLNIKKGESLALIGSNGAGKTVLGKEIVRLLKPIEGEIKINSKNEVLDISMQFQDAEFGKSIRVKNVIEIFSNIYSNLLTEKEIKEMISIFQIEDFINRKVNKLSGGQKQRINLMLALMKKPKILILDEFITSLDIISVRGIIDYLNKLRKEKNLTLIVISHNPEEIRLLTERIALLKDGKIENIFNTKDIDKKYKGAFGDFLFEVIADGK